MLGLLIHFLSSGYTLKVSFETRNEERVGRFIRELLPSATLLENYAGTFTHLLVILHRGSIDHFLFW